MIASNRPFRVDFTSLLDDLLKRICAKLQLSNTQHQQASDRYEAVGAWISRPESPLYAFKPVIYPQGSLRIGTSLKPLARNVHDLDLVCELDFDWTKADPVHVLDLLEEALRDHGTYSGMIKRKNRCIRLVYANEFHMDILPGAPNRWGPEFAIKVPDRDLATFKDSNPIGFGNWFESKAAYAVFAEDSKMEPIPDQEDMDDKSPLKFVVQLMKRNRDIEFRGRVDSAPISIVLTTLAGHNYGGRRSVNESMSSILTGINNTLLSLGGEQRLLVLNPANPKEDLSERWGTDPNAYGMFVSWIGKYWTTWQNLQGASGPQLYNQLFQMFGEQVTTDAMREQAEIIGKHRVEATLGVQGSNVGLTVAAAPAIIPVRANTFYGK
jgi:hypothetical protein